MADAPQTTAFSQESMLMDLILRLGRLREGRIGLHLHFSRLSPAYKEERYIRIATEAFGNYISGFEGFLFSLKNGDLFYVAKDVTATVLKTSAERIRLLFSQDALTEAYTERGEPAFYTLYDLEKDYDTLLKTMQSFLPKLSSLPSLSEQLKTKKDKEAIHPSMLSKIELALETTDVSGLARSQTICTLIDPTPPQPLFEEIYISIEDLQRTILPQFDITSNFWLFRYMTQTLDQRALQMLMRSDYSSSRPFSLNLNVQTVLSPEFSKFESMITAQLCGRLVIELDLVDVISNMSAFMFARDYLHDHGFRLCLDGLTHHTLPFYNRSDLGFDLMKILWTPNGLDTIQTSMLPEVRRIIMDSGQAHIILCRCDNDEAIKTGQDLGIVMFQGRAIDRQLRNL
ncbi:MAG: EAL domain-containing protein [Proteobacteria bacterium]|nr:EAL domain-containing protein [Pseudomonadota bacterium]